MLTTIELFIQARQADGRAPATIRDYRRVLEPFARQNKAQICALTRDDVRAYVAGLRSSSWASGHVAIHVRNLRAFLRWCHGEGYTTDDLSKAVKAPKQTMRMEAPLSDDEIKRLLATCDADRVDDRRDRAIMLVLLDTGMRAGELLSMRVQNIQGNIVFLDQKKSQPRAVILGEITQRAMLDYCGEAGPVWTGRRGALGYNGLIKMLHRRAALAGIERQRVHPHIFRKTFTTQFLDNGGDPERLRVLAGWSGYEMLKIYCDSNISRLVDAHKRAGPVDNLLAL